MIGFAWFEMHRSDSPGFSWGPNQYVYNMLLSMVVMGPATVGIGIIFLMIGIRRLRRPCDQPRTGAGRRGPNL